MEFIEEAGKHPLMIAAGVIALVLIMKSGSGGQQTTSTVDATLLQSQSMAEATDVSLAGIEAQNSAVRASASSADFTAGVSAQTAIAINKNNNFTAMYLATLSNGTNLATVNSNAAVNSQKIEAGQTIALSGLATDLKKLEVTTNGNLAATVDTLNANVHMFDYNMEETSKNLPLLLTHAETMLNIQTQGAEAIANILKPVQPDQPSALNKILDPLGLFGGGGLFSSGSSSTSGSATSGSSGSSGISTSSLASIASLAMLFFL
jgi:hypothetical protein